MRGVFAMHLPENDISKSGPGTGTESWGYENLAVV